MVWWFTTFLLLQVHHCVQKYLPHWSKWTWALIGMPLETLPLLLHQAILQRLNLFPTNDRPDPMRPLCGNSRPADGYGVDSTHPPSGMVGGEFGRSMPRGVSPAPQDPDVQFVAQRLLSRQTFLPAGEQLNVLAAAWIQAMVHD